MRRKVLFARWESFIQMTDNYIQQDAELRGNLRRAKEALALAYVKVATEEDWRGTTYKPTKLQRERIEAAQRHVHECSVSLDAFLNCIR